MTERAWELTLDCPACRTEGTWAEIYVEGMRGASEGHCEVCGHRREQGRVVHPGLQMADPDVARRALDAWAKRQGLSTEELAHHIFGLDLDEVIARYHRSEPVSTVLDAIAFLFPAMGCTVSAAPRANVPPPPRTSSQEPASPPDDPHTPGKVLATVMVADGTLLPRERAYIDRFLERHQLPPLAKDAIRPWRPHELGPVRDPELARATLEAAVELMHLDGIRDLAELRVVRTFARVWGIADEQIDVWDRHYARRHAPPLRALWRALTHWTS